PDQTEGTGADEIIQLHRLAAPAHLTRDVVDQADVELQQLSAGTRIGGVPVPLPKVSRQHPVPGRHGGGVHTRLLVVSASSRTSSLASRMVWAARVSISLARKRRGSRTAAASGGCSR